MRVVYPSTGRPDLTTVLTKLHIFRLTQFQKIIFLDADVLPIRPLSHLFNIPHEFSAAPDVGWPDIFNSGVLVVSPGNDKFNELYELIKTKPSWDGGDQGLLNEWRGENWNRLSFTYNTTPTAAYTYVPGISSLSTYLTLINRYAPAYERYGSKISALHFIGPNKPWNALPNRPPFAPLHTESSDSSHQRAYDYESLVDRWFEVYDHHYRANTLEAQMHFEVKPYAPAWDHPAQSQQTKSYDLEELRHLTIAGIGSSGPATHPGEGIYQSMPLEGRIDLMRPRKSVADEEEKVEAHNWQTPLPSVQIPSEDWDGFPSESFSYDEAFSTPLARQIQLDEHGRWQTLSTPDPREVPGGPRIGIVPLPFTPTPILAFGRTASDFYASESEPEGISPARLLSRPSSAGGYHHHHHHSHGHHSQVAEEKTGDKTQYHNGHFPRYQGDKPSLFQSDHDTPAQNLVPQRTISPPLLSWNPALEPPPSDAPPNAFPSDTYFANVWDQTPSRQNDPGASSPDSSRLFEPPPTPAIPASLLKQGHYRNVTGENHTTPSPDRNKVRKSIFPWEENPRPLPGRVFPDSDAPSPSLFLSPASLSQTSTTNPSTPEMRGPTVPSRISPLSPLRGFSSSLNFVNAWDSDPAIQKYATRLVKPPQLPTPLAPAFNEEIYRKGRRKSRDERSEASSRDGDDEDNADEEDEGEPAPLSATKWDDEDDSEGEKVRTRSRSGSVASASLKPSILAAPAAKKPKRYKDQGVQTTIETREQGIQVDPPVKPDRNPKKSPMVGKRHWPPAMTTSKPSAIGNDNSSTVGVVSLQPPMKKKPSSISSPLQSPMKPVREFISPPPLRTETSSPPLFKSSMRTSSASTLTGTATPMPPPPQPIRSRASSLRSSTSSIARQTSNDSSLASPASSYGPLSPLDAHVLFPPVRKGGRVWDPARGVELFKKGSEEVLARFLRMGSFDDEAR